MSNKKTRKGELEKFISLIEEIQEENMREGKYPPDKVLVNIFLKGCQDFMGEES